MCQKDHSRERAEIHLFSNAAQAAVFTAVTVAPVLPCSTEKQSAANADQ